MAKDFKGFVKAITDSGFSIFESIAAASRALKIDAANIRKVLTGQRPRAGGLSFVYTLERPKSSKIRAKLKEQEAVSEHKTAVQAVHDRLFELNKRFTNAKKAGTLENDPVMQKMMSHTDYFGQIRGGRYRISAEHLSQFSTDELNNLLSILSREEGQYKELFRKKSKKGLGKAALAAIFGVSEKEISGYDDLVPAIFELMRLGKEDKFFRYSDLSETLFGAVQDGMDEDVLTEYMNDIYQAYAGNDIAAYEAVLEAMANVDEEYKLPYD